MLSCLEVSLTEAPDWTNRSCFRNHEPDNKKRRCARPSVRVDVQAGETTLLTMDTLKGAALILAFLSVIGICVTWIQIWESTWQAAVEPTKEASTKLA